MDDKEIIEMWKDRYSDLQKDLECANKRIDDLESVIKDTIYNLNHII